MAYRYKKQVVAKNCATEAQDEQEVLCRPYSSSLLVAWEPNQPITIRFKQFLKLTGIGRSTAFEMWNPRSRLYDEKMPVGFKLFNSPNSPRFFFYQEVIAWLAYRAEQPCPEHVAKKGGLEA